MTSSRIDPDDHRYSELLAGMYLGSPPPWVSKNERARLKLASDGRRLSIARTLTRELPRTAFYASALLGEAFLAGVTQTLIELPPSPLSFAEKTLAACVSWIMRADQPALLAVLDYDLFLRGADDASRTTDGEMLRAPQDPRADLAERTFTHDVLAFAAMLDDFRIACAPPTMVAAYAPAARTQRLVAYREEGEVRARETALS